MSSWPQDWDIVIAGAGVAGLSLAVELAEHQFSHLRVLLIEPRLEYVRDRTWSFWALPNAVPKRWEKLGRTSWPRWRVSLDGSKVTSRGDVAYASVRSDVFYDEALRIIAKAPNIQWLRGAALSRSEASAQGVQLTTQPGQHLRTKLLFDSRPPAPPTPIEPSDWVQHFTGWEVQTKQPCFDPQCVDLMAFERSSTGLHFMYCLPYSSTLALVESTWISRASVQARVDAEAELKQELTNRCGGVEYEITFREQGGLPLMPRMIAAQPNVTRIGRAGGTLRAATGYAFCATLQQTSEMAASLAQHLSGGYLLVDWKAPVARSSAMDAWMDQVLFRVLESDWQAAPDYFVSLFERMPERQLIRFLQGCATWRDRLAVMQALPAWPFMRASVR